MEQCICSTQKKVCKKSAHCQSPQKSQIVSAESPHNALQLNKYETEPYFLQFFHSNNTVCLIIHVFCASCDPEIVLNSDPNYYAQY